MDTRLTLTILLSALFLGAGAVWLFDRFFLHGGRVARARKSRAAYRDPLPIRIAARLAVGAGVVTAVCSLQFQTFRIPSGAMMPTLTVGDYILVDRLAYGYRLPMQGAQLWKGAGPQRGDVIVFDFPGFTCTADGVQVRSDLPCDRPVAPVRDMKYIKRVIGLPGDTIRYRNKILVVNGREQPQTPAGLFVGEGEDARRMTGAQVQRETMDGSEYEVLQMPGPMRGREGEWTVPEGQYFVLGDNRDNSEDSRYWGFVPEDALVGKALLVWMAWNDGVSFQRVGKSIK